MLNDRVPDDAHLMRFVPYAQQIRDPDSNEFLGIASTAFALRDSDKGGLSVTWIEHYGRKCLASVGIAASAFRDSLRSKKLGAQSYFVVGTAAETRVKAAEHGKQIRIVHAPDGPNTGHVEIRKFTDEDSSLLEAFAVEVYAEHIPVKDIPVVPEGSYAPA